MLERFLRMSGVTDKQLDRQTRRMELGNEEFIAAIEEMIDDITVHELRDVVEIRQLLPEEQWDRYELLEIIDLREQLLLKEALKRLRVAYRKVLHHGRKKKRNRNQEDEEGSE